MNWDLGVFPEHAGKTLVFNQLLDNLRTVHEQACVRIAVLEKELARNGIQGIVEGAKGDQWSRGDLLGKDVTRSSIQVTFDRNREDQWAPCNFCAPQEGPPPRRPPRRNCTPRSSVTSSTCTPRTFTPRSLDASDILALPLAKQHEYLSQRIGGLSQSIDKLAEQQGYHSQQIAKVLTLTTMSKPAVPVSTVLMTAENAVPANSALAKADKAKQGLQPVIAEDTCLEGLPSVAEEPSMFVTGMGTMLPDRVSSKVSIAADRSSSKIGIASDRLSSKIGTGSQRVSSKVGNGKVTLSNRVSQLLQQRLSKRQSSNTILRATMKFAIRTSEKRDKTNQKRWSIGNDKIEGPCGEMRMCMQKALDTTVFAAVSGSAIFAYAVTIAVETNMMAHNPGMKSSTLQNLHFVFMGIFCVELGLRFLADGWATLCGKDAAWNRLDALFIFSGVAELIMQVAFGSGGSGSAGQVARSVRIFRVLRTLRLVRSLRQLYEFQKMAYAVLSSLKTLLCSLFLLSFVMFFFAVWFTQTAANLQMRMEIQNLELRFGDLMSTSYTLFASISGGIGWDECYMPLLALSPWTAQGFIVYIALVYFGVLNVVTSVFVESVTRSVQKHKDIIVKDKEEEKKIAMAHVVELFKQVDDDGSGLISLDEMDYFLEESTLSKYMEALDIPIEDTRLLFRLLDCDGSGTVNVEEFCEGCLRLKGNAKSIDLAALAFQLKNFYSKWGEFTGYVEENFADIRLKLLEGK